MNVALPGTAARRPRALKTLLIAALAVAGCQDSATAPAPIAPIASPAASETKFWDELSSVAWNTTARGLITAGGPTGPAGSAVAQVRVLTYLSVAQYNAVVRAEDTKKGGLHASPAGAAAAASVEVLKRLNTLTSLTNVNFPTAGPDLDKQLAAQRAAAVAGGNGAEFLLGEDVGLAVAKEVIAYASTDGANQTAPPDNNGKPGETWTPNPAVPPSPTPPAIVRGLYGARTFALTSGSQFRPGPPPAFGSDAFRSAFAVVYAAATSDNQDYQDLAVRWAGRGGSYMNEVASDMIVAHHRNEREAARILALANMAGFDVTNACFDAKFTYYYIRPSRVRMTPTQVGDAFKTRVQLPNHPSYPSGHSCQTAAYATVLADAFPEERGVLAGMVEEAGWSRIVAGLHYLFDCTVGQELGRNVANWVLSKAPNGHKEIALNP